MNGGWPTVAVQEIVDPVATWNPASSGGDSFEYIDISAIDSARKVILGTRTVACREAPSRARQLVRAGDILVSTVRPNLNTVARVGPEHDGATASTGLCVLRPRIPAVDEAYLFHWVRSQSFIDDMTRRATGASYPAVSDRIVHSSTLPLPSLRQQHKIADTLDRADTVRAKRRAALAHLDELIQAIYLSMFEHSPGRPEWPRVIVGDFVERFEAGRNVVADNPKTPAEYRVLKVSAVTSLRYDPGESKPAPLNYQPPRKHLVEPGDLLFSRANTTSLIGATAYVQQTPPNMLLPDKLWRFVWHKPLLVHPLFVRTLFHQESTRRLISALASGSSGSMKNVSQEKVLTIPVILPPLGLQREFARRVAAVEGVRERQRAHLAELDALFSSLEHRAFRGEL